MTPNVWADEEVDILLDTFSSEAILISDVIFFPDLSSFHTSSKKIHLVSFLKANATDKVTVYRPSPFRFTSMCGSYQWDWSTDSRGLNRVRSLKYHRVNSPAIPSPHGDWCLFLSQPLLNISRVIGRNIHGPVLVSDRDVPLFLECKRALESFQIGDLPISPTSSARNFDVTFINTLTLKNIYGSSASLCIIKLGILPKLETISRKKAQKLLNTPWLFNSHWTITIRCCMDFLNIPCPGCNRFKILRQE